MHQLVFHISAVWVGILLAASVVAVMRGRSRLDQILAADTMVLLVIAFMLVVTGGRLEPQYTDVALVMGLLGFATSVALVRLVSRGDEQ